MPYNQLFQMNATGEQSLPNYFAQNPPTHEFGVPSAGSLDSGYEEVDPFDKSRQYRNANNLDFDSACAMNPNGTASIDFGVFGYEPPIVQRNSSDFGNYQDLATSFQPILDPPNPYPQYHPSPSIDTTSEDGRTASLSSESPRQGPIGLDVSPRLPQQPFWSSGAAALKRNGTDSSAEINRATEERVVPKTAPSRGRPRKRIPHTAVERRYRENLNAHLEKLRAAVPNLTAAQRRKSNEGADPMKPSKCEVLMGAVDYIKRLEAENERLKQKMN